jgi:hypothetical protein
VVERRHGLVAAVGRVGAAGGGLVAFGHLEGRLDARAVAPLGDRETNPGKRKDLYKKAIKEYGRSHDKRAASFAAELGERLKER